MKNKEIRMAVKKSGVRFWMIAEELGIQDSALSRKLRKELPTDEKEEVLAVIKRLAGEAV